MGSVMILAGEGGVVSHDIGMWGGSVMILAGGDGGGQL